MSWDSGNMGHMKHVCSGCKNTHVSCDETVMFNDSKIDVSHGRKLKHHVTRTQMYQMAGMFLM